MADSKPRVAPPNDTLSSPGVTTNERLLDRLRAKEAANHTARRRNNLAIQGGRVLLLLAILMLWELASNTRLIDPTVFSRPSSVWAFVIGDVTSGNLWENLIVTLRQTLIALVVGAAAGILVGMLRVNYRYLSELTGPYLTFLNALPRVALAPMFITLFGIGELSKIVLAITLVFFIAMISTEAGARSIEPEYITLLRTMGASKSQIFRLVLLPGAVPGIFAGLRLSVVYAMLGVIFGEMLASQAGLGQQILFYSNAFRPDGVFGTIFILACVSLVLNFVVVALERKLLALRGMTTGN